LEVAELPDTFWERSLLTRPRDRDVVLMDRHGAVALGTSLLDAFCKLETLEHTAKILLHARTLGVAEQQVAGDERGAAPGMNAGERGQDGNGAGGQSESGHRGLLFTVAFRLLYRRYGPEPAYAGCFNCSLLTRDASEAAALAAQRRMLRQARNPAASHALEPTRCSDPSDHV